ncbi:hypothetical protein GN958_ATG09143 [Phytophthora infestans]|uniref:Uncharacterized protein n=1 Tax=Phytophthora infestans TaxID=4787 RepID=A0A8S9UQK9_PHYIN|nr:hypothetical protein GN958_ATG09143 [Phytophthora infestans]
MRSVIPCEAIPEQWLLADEDEEDTRGLDIMQKFYFEHVEAPSSRVIGHNKIYRSGFAVYQRIAEVVVDIRSRSFLTYFDGAGEQVTNLDDTSVCITKTDDAGEEVANLESVQNPDSTPDIKIEKVARVEAASSPASSRRELDLDSVGIESSDDEVVSIVLNTTSRPAGRPREKRAVKKAKRRKEFEETKTHNYQIRSARASCPEGTNRRDECDRTWTGQNWAQSTT